MVVRLHLLLLFVFLFSGSLSADNFYWSGGSGHWNDASQWLDENQKPLNRIPGADDLVIFDEDVLFEGDIVQIDESQIIGGLTIRSWYGIIQAGSDINLTITGEIEVAGNTRLQIPGSIIFSSTAGAAQKLNFGNQRYVSQHIVFKHGSFQLESALLTDGTIDFEKVSFNSGQQFIEAASLNARRQTGMLNFQGSTIRLNQEPSGSLINSKVLSGSNLIIVQGQQSINSIDSVVVSVTSPLCNGQCNGSVTVSIYSSSGGPYSALLTSGPQNCSVTLSATAFGASGTCTGLCANTYGLTVIDSSDLSQTQQFVQVPGPNPILVSNFIKRPPTCFGDCNGWINVNAIGGSPPFTYLWSAGGTPTQQTDSNLCAGNYSVVITDQNNCSQTFNTNLTQPNEILSNGVPTHITCNGLCNGAATVVPSGGNGSPPNYVYSWTNVGGTFSSASQNISNLCPGSYIITITDDSLCAGVDTIIVTEPTQLQLNPYTTNISCGGACDGIAGVNVSGGTGSYTITWSNGGSGSSQSGLCPGTLSVVVSDANGCSDSVQFIITEPAPLNANVTGTNITCTSGCNGTATSSPTGGTGPFNFSWSTGFVSNGLTSTISGLCPGTYSVTVTDSNNCQHIDSILITEPPVLTTAIISSNISCNGVCDGSATLNISGGTPGYLVLWSNGASTLSINGLCPDTLSVSILDNNGCVTSDTVIITEPPVLSVNVPDDTVSCGGICNGVLFSQVNGGTPGYTYSWSPGGSTGPSASSLCVGSYVLTVSDTNGCVATDTANVLNPNNILGVIATSPASCNGVCDATASVSASGGFPPYTFVWCNGQTGAVATGLCGGTTCSVTITDAQGCSVVQNVAIAQPPALTSSMAVTNVTCNAACTGSATITAGGGTAPLIVSWNTVPVTSGTTISNLCAGTYVATITDFNGCVSTDTAVITEPAPIAPGLTIGNVTCNGLCNGTAALSPTGGTAPYSYSWSSGLPPSSAQSNLCPGTYQVTISDANNCSIIVPVVITEPTVLNATVNNINASCGAICDGSASVLAGGGTAPYSYLWSTSPAQTGDTAVNLCVGNYNVQVSDSNGCTVSLPVTISPVVFISINSTGGQPTCFGVCNGQATAFASGGATPYTYQWSNGQTTQSANGLCGGITYYVTATDANGCNNIDSITLTQPAQIQAAINTTNATCGNICNGAASVSASGGVAPYSYLWSNGQTSPLITNLCGGMYYLTITDANGCTRNDSVLINAPTNINPNPTISNATCNNADGSILLAPSGGNAPYSYQWVSPFSTANPLQNIASGIYQVTIFDAAGCSDTFSIIVNDINGPSLATTMGSTSCFGACDGTGSGVAAGGTAPYTYLWTPGGQTTAAISNLCAGVYSLSVTDALGCMTTVTDTVHTPSPILSNPIITDVTCNAFCDGAIAVNPTGGTGPYTYSWQGGQSSQTVNGLCPGNYIVTITDGNNCSLTDTFTVGNQTIIVPNAAVNNVNCNGGCTGSIVVNPAGGNPSYTYSWSPSGPTSASNTNLCAGNYSLTITDSLGCTSVSSYTITEPLPLAATVNTTNNACSGQCSGSISIAATGGSGSYSYFWLPGGQTSANINNLCAGSYTVTICDPLAPGCCITQTISITEPLPISVSSSGTNISCFNGCNGLVTATGTGGTGTLSYLWNPGNLSGPIQTGLCAGTYLLTVTDANGCSAIDSVVLSQPSAITPNASLTHSSCNGSCDGSIVLNPSGGAGAYSFLWSPGGETTSSITSLCAGSYSVAITDSNGCVTNFAYAITEPAAISASFVTNAATCGLVPCDGDIFLTPSGGVGSPYSVLWSNGSSGNSLTGVCAGLYTAYITDASGCMDSIQVPLNNLNGPSTSNSSTDVTCSGDCDGSAIVTASGVNPPFAFSWFPGGMTNDTVNSLCAGTYQVQVTDTLLCLSFETVVINEPAPVSGLATLTNVSCTGLCDGSISINPSGGSGTYSHSWSNGGSTATLTNLCAGTYTDTITDSNGCIGIETVQVIVPNPLLHSMSSTNISCNGACDGTTILSISGGTAPYAVSWSNGVNQVSNGTSALTGLCPGVYIATVTDFNGCTFQDSVTISEPAPLQVNAVATNISCNGACNGSIALSISGGTMNYNVQWSNGATGNTLSGLCPGLYSVQVSDNNGCQFTQSFLISEPAPFSIALSGSNVTCNAACDGQLIALPTGGTSPYFYQWNPGGYTTDTVSGVCAGNYTLTAVDDNGCTFSGQVTITEPSAISPNLVTTSPPCGSCTGQVTSNPTGGSGPPYSFQWSNGSSTATASNLCAGLYILDITDNSGCVQTVQVPVSNVNGPVVSSSVVQPGCAGTCDGSIALTSTGTAPFTYSWSPGGFQTDSIGNLCAGTYFALVTDGSGCITVQSDTLTDPPAIIANPTVAGATCGNCDGSASLSPTGGVAPYSYAWGNGGSTSSQSSLCAGIYPVQITDATGCAVTENLNVSNTGGPTGEQLTTTPVSCFGNSDGSATINGLGGTPPYTYFWLPSGLSGNSINGMSAGVHTAQITDANGCIRTTNVIIQSPSQIQGNPLVSPATCGVCDGAISLSPSGGQAPYSFAWSGGLAPQANQSNLCVGLYTVTITDALGCSEIYTLAVNSNNAPAITVTNTNASCGNACDGAALATATGGTTPYTYLWSNGSTNASQSGLCAGTFVVQVTDANGCASSAQTTITQPSSLSFGLPSITDASCSGNCDGDATIFPSGGTLPYTFSWNPAGASGQTASNLCPGIQIVSVTDANGCSASQSITITDSPALNSTWTATDATCGQCDGSASITPAGGIGPYVITWADGSQGAIRNNLCAGVHSATITDASGCSEQVSIVVNNSSAPVLNLTSITHISCGAANTGAASVAATGGTTPYSFLWSPGGQSGTSLNNLAAGNYHVQVTDSNGCISILPVTINDEPQINVSAVINNASCGQCNGQVALQVNGGQAPFTYSWSGGLPASPNQSGLCAGTYFATITDANGCSSTETIPVSSNNGPVLSMTGTNVSCAGDCDGSATVVATGGSGTYTYQWSPVSQTSPTLNNLCPNDYYVLVTDVLSGCSSINMITINEPAPLIFSNPFSTPASCGGSCDGSGVVFPSGGVMPYVYSWSNGGTLQNNDSLCAGNNVVTISDANGCVATQTVVISQPVPIQIDTISVVRPACPNQNTGSIDVSISGGEAPYITQWSNGAGTEDLTGIPSGFYTLVVTDSRGCIDSLNIDFQPLVPLFVVALSDTTYCEGEGPVTLTGTGATTYEWHLLDGTLIGSGSSIVVDPNPGIHTYVLYGFSSGCVGYDTVIVQVYPAPLADAGEDQSILPGDIVVIGGNPSGAPGSTFNWQPSEGLMATDVSNPEASPDRETIYYLTVTSPDGCTATDSVRIIILPEIIFPDGITPNGDGRNDVWIIDNIHLFPGALVEVYNRWGQLVFHSPGYVDKFDGTYQGKMLPVGTYYYVIDLNDDRFEPYTGPITIMR